MAVQRLAFSSKGKKVFKEEFSKYFSNSDNEKTEELPNSDDELSLGVFQKYILYLDANNLYGR